MPRFTDPKKLAKYLEDAANATLAESIITTQARLGSTAVSPYSEGRFRSSWFASEGMPSGETASEGTDSPNTDAQSLKVDYRRKYFLTNSLPYAQQLCIEGRVVSKDANWFRDFRKSQVPKIQEVAAKKVKQQFQL